VRLAGLALGLVVAAPLGLGVARVAARPRPRPISREALESRKAEPARPSPLRVVVRIGGQPLANCIFAVAEVGERAAGDTPLRDTFNAGEPIWGRCYLPDRLGINSPGDLVDVITVDGKRIWEQKYDRAVPADALARLVPYHAVLRGVLDRLPPGTHRVQVDGVYKRGRSKRLYHGEFGYVR
jgi:hypothetical protein